MNQDSTQNFVPLLQKLLRGEDGEDDFYLKLVASVTVAADGAVTVRLREDLPAWGGAEDGVEEFIFNPGEMWYDGEKRV